MPDSRSGLGWPDGLSREYLLHHRVCPSGTLEDGVVRLAVTADSDPGALNELSLLYGCPIEPELVSLPELEQRIERLATQADHRIEFARLDSAQTDIAADVRDLANQPPVVRYVNLLIRDAFDAGASDIHLEAERAGLVGRVRLDGVLVPSLQPPQGLHHAVISRIKLLSELDIAERRRPQDGRIRVRLEARELDLRVSTVPTMFGESVVLRLLDGGGGPVALSDLGMPPEILTDMERLSRKSHGLILVTGPTGSGKTTTLYAALGCRETADEKLITVEDPVEYQLSGVTQVPVHRQAGVTFGSALRSLLRQDPDVIMVGEMRDSETAEVAVQAAMTGHLVFSTLHTNDAISAVPRLIDLGLPEYLVAATLRAVLAQRLVRRICDSCRARYEPAGEAISAVAGNPDFEAGEIEFTRGAGCSSCRGSGYRGRVGVFELVTVSDAVRDAIVRGAGRSELRAAAAVHGWKPLRADGWAKVAAGLTTIEEVLRVAHD